MKLYKTIEDNWKSENGNCKWELDKWKKIRGKLKLCEKGFHASPRIIDAMGYFSPGLICEVETRGESLSDGNKSVWSEMRVVKFCKWEKEDSVALSIYAAEKVIKNFEKEFPKDDRPRKAIEAAKAWLKNPTNENESAARSAESAARSAESAAYEKTLNDIEKWIKRRLNKKGEV